MKEKIRVLLTDDHNIVRDGLKLILQLSDRIEVCGEAGSLRETMEKIPETNPDVILLDFRLDDGDGVNGCIRIKSQFPNIKIIILTAYSQDYLVMETIRAGADGYLLKSIKSEDLIRNIMLVYEGGSVLDPSVTEGVFSNIVVHHEGVETKNKLSLRESSIMQMISLGKANKEIAETLRISDKTVRNYISNIFRKLNVSNRTEAASYWIKNKTQE